MNQNGSMRARIMPAVVAEPPTSSPRDGFASAESSAVRPIRILIADDHAIIRDGLRVLLSNQPDFVVVGEAADGMGVIAAVRDLNPDVLLLDVMMPKMDGFEVLEALRGLNAAVRTILLASKIDGQDTLRALQLGGRGIVFRDTLTDLLFKSIRRVHEGEVWISHAAISELVAAVARHQDYAPAPPPQPSRDFGLTPREHEVLRLIVEGETNKGIASRLAVGEDTVKHHLTNIFNKTGASTRLELALFALHHRLAAF